VQYSAVHYSAVHSSAAGDAVGAGSEVLGKCLLRAKKARRVNIYMRIVCTSCMYVLRSADLQRVSGSLVYISPCMGMGPSGICGCVDPASLAKGGYCELLGEVRRVLWAHKCSHMCGIHSVDMLSEKRAYASLSGLRERYVPLVPLVVVARVTSAVRTTFARQCPCAVLGKKLNGTSLKCRTALAAHVAKVPIA
jgi:hypothetical protein